MAGSKKQNQKPPRGRRNQKQNDRKSQRAQRPQRPATFKLLDMAGELVTQIFECLLTGPLPTETPLPLPAAIVAHREALRNLCRTSKVCYAIAMPLLYRHVVITDHLQTACLVPTLVANEDRRHWMRSLAVLGDLSHERLFKQSDEAILVRSMEWLHRCEPGPQEGGLNGLLRQAKDRIHFIYEYVGAKPIRTTDFSTLRRWPDTVHADRLYHTSLRSFYSRLLLMVLCMGPHIDDLLITRPSYPYRSELQGHPDVSRADIQAVFSGEDPKGENSRPDIPYRVIDRIRKRADPRAEYFYARPVANPRMIYRHFEPDPLALRSFPSTSWELLRDDGSWHQLLPPDYKTVSPVGRPPAAAPLALLAHLTDLRLYDTHTHPGCLRFLLRHAKKLKTLHYVCDARNWNAYFGALYLSREDARATLQEALDEVKGTLVEVRVSLAERKADEAQAAWAPLSAAVPSAVGKKWTLPQLKAVAKHRIDVSQFPRLEKVDIEEPFLASGDRYEDKLEDMSSDDTGGWEDQSSDDSWGTG